MNHKITAEQLKSSITPTDFYRHHLPDAKLNKAGWNDGGLCPFHLDNKAGSFHVNLQTGAFRCFSCNTGGCDIIAFTMELHNLNFKETLTRLSSEWIQL